MSLTISWIIQMLLIPVLSPLFIGITRKVKAKFQNRTGATIFQPYKDFWKLFHKDEVVSLDASWIFLFVPYIIFALTILIGASIPLIPSLLISNNFTGDFLVVVYLVALGTFLLALAGIDVGGGFGGFGSSREMMMASLTEAGLVLSLLTLALISKSTNLFDISSNIANLPFSEFAPVALAFISFFISMLAETCRYPFDNPATHLELTMIHEAMILEYSGKRLALVEWASANKYLIFMSLGINLFFPQHIYIFSLLGVVLGFVLYLFKISIFCFLIAVIESTIAKLRIFKLPDLLFTSFVISFIAIFLIF